MSTSIVHFAHCEQAFALSPIPIWVVEVEAFKIVWANAPALDFWRASSIEELTARDMLVNAPKPVMIRLTQALNRIKAGDVFEEDWTFYPKGKPMHVILHLRPVILQSGKLGMLNQALQLHEDASEPTVRALAMLRHAKATLVYVNAQGTILTQNSGSISEFGDNRAWGTWFTNPEVAAEILRHVLSGKPIEIEASVEPLHGRRIHSILAHSLRDPVTGEVGVLIQHFDVTDRVEAERLVQAQLAQLQEQQREIFKLSTPFLDVGADTLALPLIGKIDESRAAKIAAELLEMVANRNIQRVILDITGVVSVDDTSLVFLRRLVDAIVLLGAKPILTGIRSDLARMLAASDENLAGIAIRRSLADGLATRRVDGHGQRKTVLPR